MERQRKFERVNFLATAMVIPGSGKASFRAHVTTLGRGGLGLFTDGFLEVGDLVELDLSWVDQDQRAFRDRVRGAVVSSQVGVEGNTLGVKFSDLLGDKNKALLRFIEKAQEMGD